MKEPRSPKTPKKQKAAKSEIKYERAPELDPFIDKVRTKYLQHFTPEQHGSIEKAKFVGIFRFPEKSRGGKTVFGSARKVSDKERIFVDADFIIEVWKDFWTNGSTTPEEKEKEALIFHELKHCVYKEKVDKKTGNITYMPKLVPHDFEGFIKEYELFGDWTGDLPEAFSK